MIPTKTKNHPAYRRGYENGYATARNAAKARHDALVSALEKIRARTKGYIETEQATYCERQDYEDATAALFISSTAKP